MCGEFLATTITCRPVTDCIPAIYIEMLICRMVTSLYNVNHAEKNPIRETRSSQESVNCLNRIELRLAISMVRLHFGNS